MTLAGSAQNRQPFHQTDLYVDPLYIEPSSGDYRPAINSPVIDTGDVPVEYEWTFDTPKSASISYTTSLTKLSALQAFQYEQAPPHNSHQLSLRHQQPTARQNWRTHRAQGRYAPPTNQPLHQPY